MMSRVPLTKFVFSLLIHVVFANVKPDNSRSGISRWIGTKSPVCGDCKSSLFLRGGWSNDSGDDSDDDSDNDDGEEAGAHHDSEAWSHRALIAAITADVGSLLAQNGRLEEAVTAYKLSLFHAPPDWPPVARVLISLGMLLREDWDKNARGEEAPPQGVGARSSLLGQESSQIGDSLRLLEAAARSRPTDPTVHFQLGTTNYMAKRIHGAVAAYTAACDAALVNEDPLWAGIPPILNNLATLALDAIQHLPSPQDKYALLQVAVLCLRESALREPDAPCTLANLASSLWSNLTMQAPPNPPNKLEGADNVPFFFKAGGGPAEAAAKEQQQQQQQQQHGWGGYQGPLPYGTEAEQCALDEAILVFGHALQVVPAEWAHVDQLWVRLALALVDRGDPGEAVRELERALEAAHAFANRNNLNRNHNPGEEEQEEEEEGVSSSAQNNKKRKKFGKIFRTPPPAQTPEKSSSSAVGGEDFETSVLQLHVGPGHYPPPWWHHVCHLLGDAMVKAKAEADEGRNPSAAVLNRRRRRGGGAAGSKQLDFGAILKRCGRHLPPDPLLRAEMGRTMLRLGLVDQGTAELQAALNLGDLLFGGEAAGAGGGGKDGRTSMAAAARGRGEKGGKESNGKKGGPWWPGRATVLHGLGSAHGINGEVDKAIALFRASLLAEPHNPNAAATHFLLSRSLAEVGNERAALDELEHAVGAGLWVSDALLNGSAFEELRDHPRFLDIRKRMAKNSPSSGPGGGGPGGGNGGR